jgi:hypothetical protein
MTQEPEKESSSNAERAANACSDPRVDLRPGTAHPAGQQCHDDMQVRLLRKHAKFALYDEDRDRDAIAAWPTTVKLDRPRQETYGKISDSPLIKCVVISR